MFRVSAKENSSPGAPLHDPGAVVEATEFRGLAMEFSTFILSLASSAQVHMGVVPNPATGKEERRLPLAKETIDLMVLLEEKTQGNLSDEEAGLIEHALNDLRMMYVEMSKQGERDQHEERGKA